MGKVVSEALNALAEAELEIRKDFAGSKEISPLRGGRVQTGRARQRTGIGAHTATA